ncbi:FliH/SctL family protein [Paratissierella segnis]|uniref:FliH/SctL family protein n=1 Tax=Paratissierella segnis TaxID=2763679 RepID=UPI00223C0111|nr:FliH/SctL family protein [Paratissierella segnis]
MIKIQSSYRVIKGNNICCEGESKITIKNSYDNKIDFYPSPEEEEKCDDLADLESIKDEIRASLTDDIKKELYKKTAEERRKIIEKANEEANNLLEEAKKQGFDKGFKKGCEEGFKEGLTNGYNQGILDAKSEASKIKNNAVKIVEDAQESVSDYFRESHDQIIELAADMAESIVHLTIDESSENILMLVNPILQEFGKTENIVITCHPDNLDYLKLYKYKLEEVCPNTIFTILSDANLEKDGCIVENENKIIDLQIRKQLNSILESIKDIDNME